MLILIALIFGTATIAHKIEGSIQLNGENYQAECTCSAPEDESRADVKCHPNSTTITQEASGEGASYEEIEEKFGDPSTFDYK
jgi:hypothetical protein